MPIVLLKYYPSDDNSKYILENRKDSRGVHTHLFSNLTSLRNYLRTELKIERSSLNEIVDLLTETGIVYTSNPLLKHYIKNGDDPPTINIVESKSNKSNYFYKNPSIQSNKSNHSKYIKRLEHEIQQMKGGDNNIIPSKHIVEPSIQSSNGKSLEDRYIKKLDQMETRFNRRLEEIDKKNKKMDEMETRFNRRLEDIEKKNKKMEVLYKTFIDNQLERDYRQNDKLLEYLHDIKDVNLLWFLMILNYRRFRNEQEEELFYKKCCNRVEDLI